MAKVGQLTIRLLFMPILPFTALLEALIKIMSVTVILKLIF